MLEGHRPQELQQQNTSGRSARETKGQINQTGVISSRVKVSAEKRGRTVWEILSCTKLLLLFFGPTFPFMFWITEVVLEFTWHLNGRQKKTKQFQNRVIKCFSFTFAIELDGVRLKLGGFKHLLFPETLFWEPKVSVVHHAVSCCDVKTSTIINPTHRKDVKALPQASFCCAKSLNQSSKSSAPESSEAWKLLKSPEAQMKNFAYYNSRCPKSNLSPRRPGTLEAINVPGTFYFFLIINVRISHVELFVLWKKSQKADMSQSPGLGNKHHL